MPRGRTKRPKKILFRRGGEDTWFSLVNAALIKLKGEAPLAAIYAQLEAHPRTRTRRHWKAKVRQVLESHNWFVRVSKGVWALYSKYSEKEARKLERIRRKECPKRTEG